MWRSCRPICDDDDKTRRQSNKNHNTCTNIRQQPHRLTYPIYTCALIIITITMYQQLLGSWHSSFQFIQPFIIVTDKCSVIRWYVLTLFIGIFNSWMSIWWSHHHFLCIQIKQNKQTKTCCTSFPPDDDDGQDLESDEIAFCNAIVDNW